MLRLLIIITYLTIWTISNAQTDTVLMFVRPRLISEYQIIVQQKNVYVKENYTYFKGKYWLGEVDTVTLTGLTKTDSGYVDLKRKRPIFYHYYAICDPVINIVRNNASYWRMENEINEIARAKIGYDNRALLDIRNDNWSSFNFLSKHCYTDYQTMELKLRQKYMACIDSIFDDKVKRLNWIKSNQTLITQVFVDNFITTFNYSSPDFRSLEILMRNHTDLFLNSIYKLSESDFFSFTLKLGQFPQEINLTETKSALEKTVSKDKRKRKVIRKINNNKG